MNIIDRVLGNFTRDNSCKKRNIKTMSINDAYNIIKNESAFVLDVRTYQEFDNIHVNNAVNIPINNLMYMTNLLPKDKNKLIIVYCLTGERATRAANFLEQIGYTNVYMWDGGSLNSMLDKDIIYKK